MSQRWQLNRAGITNVYQYENEVLSFRDGRLLLRGVNGSGKSTAMNMLLPFLLTGKARGIDAAGEQTGVLKSWMLSGRDEKQPVGYLWLEFARFKPNSSDQHGSDQHSSEHLGSEHHGSELAGATREYLSIGCGIKANRASDTVSTWWFITSQRPQVDFDLLEQQMPLSVESLRLQIAPDPVFPENKRADYRHELTRRLYGGASLDSFLDLINAVRSPRVGDRVDLDLPQYLTDALPNLSESALIEAARPLDDLDEHRRNVSDLETTAQGLEGITNIYRNYAITELQREIQTGRNTLSASRARSRELKSAQQQATEADQAEKIARQTRGELEDKLDHLSEQIHTLERSPAYTEGKQLEDLRHHVTSLKLTLRKDEENFQLLEKRVPAVAEVASRSEHRATQNWQELSDALVQVSRAADECSLSARPPVATPFALVVVTDTPQTINEPLESFDSQQCIDQLKPVAAAALNRRADIDSVRQQYQRVEQAQANVRTAMMICEQTRELAAQGELKFEHGRDELKHVITAWHGSVESWADETRSVVVNHEPVSGFKKVPAGYLNEARTNEAQIVEVGTSEAGTNKSVTSTSDLSVYRQSLQSGIDASVNAQHRTVIALDEQCKDAGLAVEQAQIELDRLNGLTEPDVPSLDWQRQSGPGIADMVDFRDHLSSEHRAGLEAGLQASGLLSATLNEEGAQLASGELVASSGVSASRPLSQLLKVALPIDSDIEEKPLQRLLDSIETDWSVMHQSTVTTDGRFRLGVVSGRHSKDKAEYVGVGARREKLEMLRREARQHLQEVESALKKIEAGLNAERQFAQRLEKLRQTLPALTDVDSATTRALSLEEQLNTLRDQLELKTQSLADAEKRQHVADEEYLRQCNTLKLPTEQAALGSIDAKLNDIATGVDSTTRMARSVSQSTDDWLVAVERFRQSLQDAEKARERFTASLNECNTRQQHLDTLEATLGTSYREVVLQIDEYKQQTRICKEDLPVAIKQTEETIRAAQVARNDVSNRTTEHHQAEQKCQLHYRHILKITEVPGLLIAVTQNEEVASQLIQAPELDALLKTLQPHLQQDTEATTADGVRGSLRQRRNMLGAGWDAEDNQPDSTVPISIMVTGPLGQMPVADSLTTVHAQLDSLRALLTQKQDQALRNLLQGLIAREVAEKMFQARRLIDRMNDRLESVTTTHGIGVRLRWRESKELEEAVAATVKILAKKPDLRSVEEEEALRVSLAEALDEARRMAPDAPYRQLIAQVFDYREWHEMHVQLRRGDEAPRRLTRRTPLSEGEKKLVSYLPLFAAVAASCDALADNGKSFAPRFLLLDDAFAKVSEDNHASLFGLLVELDLDFIATSERLWGTHASVPGLAITEVIRDTTLDAILLEHSTWDGEHLQLSAPLNIEQETWGVVTPVIPPQARSDHPPHTTDDH